MNIQLHLSKDESCRTAALAEMSRAQAALSSFFAAGADNDDAPNTYVDKFPSQDNSFLNVKTTIDADDHPWPRCDDDELVSLALEDEWLTAAREDCRSSAIESYFSNYRDEGFSELPVWSDEDDDCMSNNNALDQHSVAALTPQSLSKVKESADQFPVIDVSELHGEGRFIFNKSDRAYMRLYDFLSDVDAPLYAFNSLMDILFEEGSAGRLDFTAKRPSRESFMKKMIKIFGQGCSPIKVDVPLEKDTTEEEFGGRSPRSVASVFVFNAKEQILTLLQDIGIFGEIENLAVDSENPFGRYRSVSGLLGEVNSGAWYDRAYDNLIQHESAGPPEFLCPLILYCDQTGTSFTQRHGLEPVMVTLSIIKEKIRNQCYRCWKPLGYIPDLNQCSAAQKAVGSDPAKKGRNCRNYHACMKVVLESLVALQETGLEMYLTLGGQAQYVRIKFAVCLFLGDSLSTDKLCCRVPSYALPRTCRACYTPFLELSQPRDSPNCNWVLQEDQAALLVGCEESGREKDQELHAKLKAVSTIRCHSSLFGLNYGDSPFGQYYACTTDLMHAFELGVVRYVLSAFLSQIPLRRKRQIDDLVDVIFARFRCSETDSFPRTNFSKGATTMTHLNAFEWPGLMLVYLILAQTYKGRSILKHRFDDNDKRWMLRFLRWEKVKLTTKRKRKLLRTNGYHSGFPSALESDSDDYDQSQDCVGDADVSVHEEEGSANEEEQAESDGECPQQEALPDLSGFPRCTANNFIELMSMLLTFHAYYKQSFFWKKGDKNEELKLHEALQEMLKKLTTTLARTEGHGWNIQKVHEVFFHLVRQIRESGRPSNTDCQVGERGLKVWGKNDARRTNRGNVSQFTEQICQRIYENSTMARAQLGMDYISRKMSLEGVQKVSVTASCDHPNQPNGMIGHPKYKVGCERVIDEDSNEFFSVQADWLGRNQHKHYVDVPLVVLELLRDEYFDTKEHAFNVLAGREIDGFTEYMGRGKRYRAHPNHNGFGSWYDYAVVQCPNNGQDLARPKRNKIDCQNNHHKKQKPNDLSDSMSALDELYGEGHVPAKILALYRNPVSGDDMAIIHACRPWMVKNEERSSVISESWHLQHVRTHELLEEGEVVVRLVPQYNMVKTSAFIDRIRVFEENPGIQEDWPNKDDSGHIIWVLSRSKHWADQFVCHE